jgi:hypothetical protein
MSFSRRCATRYHDGLLATTSALAGRERERLRLAGANGRLMLERACFSVELMPEGAPAACLLMHEEA